jgi:hypothetical protein
MPGVESVTYISGTVSRSISAQVFREGVVPMPGGAQANLSAVTIIVANSSTTGIAASELKAGDEAKLDLMLNGSLKTFLIHRSAGSDGRWDIDAGMLRLELR